MDHPTPPHPPAIIPGRAQAKLGLRTSGHAIDTGTLFAGSSEVIITHGPEVYRLRLTRQNRLILTK